MRVAVALFLLAACGTDDPAPSTWQELASGETGALLAVWGRSSDDVWVVGSRLTPTGGPTILRYDGSAWTRVDSGQTNLDLWWVFGFDNGDVVLSGSGGTILRYRGGQFERLPTPASVGTIFGMWGPAADDFWAVGDAGGGGGAVWHYNGIEFTPVQLANGGTLPSRVFKVHGQASDNVRMSCANGLTLRWDGAELTSQQTPTTNSLFSIITTPGNAVTVGGVGGVGDLFETTNNTWNVAALETPVPWRGTAAIGMDIAVVGEAGLVAQRVGSKWNVIDQTLTDLNFHSAWFDDNHGLWAVGGRFEGRLSDGLLLYYGIDTIAEVAP